MAKATSKRTTKKTTAKKTSSRKLIDKVNTGRVARGAKPIPKRTYTRKPKVVDVKVAAVEPSDFAGQVVGKPEPGPVEFTTEGKNNFFDNATMDNGFDSDGELNRIVVSPVVAARSNVVFAVREMIDAALQLEKGANKPLQVRRVLEQRQRLSAAEFDLAMDNLERAIRG